jgi:hypothetical protein
VLAEAQFFLFSFRDLSDRLNLSSEEGEKWIVNLIRETRMGSDAKIDLEKVSSVICSEDVASCYDRISSVSTASHYQYTSQSLRKQGA